MCWWGGPGEGGHGSRGCRWYGSWVAMFGGGKGGGAYLLSLFSHSAILRNGGAMGAMGDGIGGLASWGLEAPRFDGLPMGCVLASDACRGGKCRGYEGGCQERISQL
jgi:hypothetical protein